MVELVAIKLQMKKHCVILDCLQYFTILFTNMYIKYYPYYSAQNRSEFRFRDRCFFFFGCRAVEIIMVCSTVREMDARAIVLRHRLLFRRRNFGKLN